MTFVAEGYRPESIVVDISNFEPYSEDVFLEKE